MLADVKYALRRLNKSPGFTATAVVTLALGIGATTAIYALIQQVMLRSLAVAQPEQLWRIGDASPVNAVRPMYFVPEAQGTTFDDRELESRERWSHYLYNIVIWAPGKPPGLRPRCATSWRRSLRTS